MNAWFESNYLPLSGGDCFENQLFNSAVSKLLLSYGCNIIKIEFYFNDNPRIPMLIYPKLPKQIIAENCFRFNLNK